MDLCQQTVCFLVATVTLNISKYQLVSLYNSTGEAVKSQAVLIIPQNHYEVRTETTEKNRNMGDFGRQLRETEKVFQK